MSDTSIDHATSLWYCIYDAEDLADGQPKLLGYFGVPYVNNTLRQRR